MKSTKDPNCPVSGLTFSVYVMIFCSVKILLPAEAEMMTHTEWASVSSVFIRNKTVSSSKCTTAMPKIQQSWVIVWVLESF